jgi:4-diphosphocytidyl-2-C-methyl-D-erythritol kinase
MAPAHPGGVGVTQPVRLVAPAKLTLSLRITGIRDDGMHLIEAEMVTLDFHDVVEIGAGSGIELVGPERGSGPADGSNLAARALSVAGRSGHLRIDKRVPAGAGLGGGSADAAAVLRWAGVDDPMVAAELGADVPFCLAGGRARVSGIGEIVDPLDHVDRVVTLVTPLERCSTPEIYRRWDAMGGPRDPGGNDLTAAALDVVPALAATRDELGASTGQVPRLAGSGSTWFVDGAYPAPGRVVARTVPAGWSGPDSRR